jgi:hypothetical protein
MHLERLQLCFHKHQKLGIGFNLEKCMFLVYSKMDLGSLYPKRENY